MGPMALILGTLALVPSFTCHTTVDDQRLDAPTKHRHAPLHSHQKRLQPKDRLQKRPQSLLVDKPIAFNLSTPFQTAHVVSN
jgi:hypothetical protein